MFNGACGQCEDLILGPALSATGIHASNGNNAKNAYELAVKEINDAGGVQAEAASRSLRQEMR
jgi:ABC-type branched-subunit amino acid transport system substrate-binding protein